MLANWIIRSSQWFVPLCELMAKELLLEDIIHAAINAIHVGCWAHARRKWVDCMPKGLL
jgi:hypothetical protein